MGSDSVKLVGNNVLVKEKLASQVFPVTKEVISYPPSQIRPYRPAWVMNQPYHHCTPAQFVLSFKITAPIPLGGRGAKVGRQKKQDPGRSRAIKDGTGEFLPSPFEFILWMRYTWGMGKMEKITGDWHLVAA